MARSEYTTAPIGGPTRPGYSRPVGLVCQTWPGLTRQAVVVTPRPPLATAAYWDLGRHDKPVRDRLVPNGPWPRAVASKGARTAPTARRLPGKPRDYGFPTPCRSFSRVHSVSRVGRIVVPGFPHHVTKRGNRRADLFETHRDREAHLRFLRHYADRRGLSVWAYCLMTNHIHWVVLPQREESLGQALRDAHTVYAIYFNSRTEVSGHVWQGRFFSSPLDETRLWAAVPYVERKPVRAGLVERAQEYPWSSATAHCGLCSSHPVLSDAFPPAGVIGYWAAWLHEAFDQDRATERIRRQTHTGRPCGSPKFLDQVEHLLGRVVCRKKGGRPRTARNT